MTLPLLALVFGPPDDPSGGGAPGCGIQQHGTSQTPNVAEADRVLIDRLRESDAGAVDDIVTQYYANLVGFAANIVGEVAGAEDVVQDTLVAVWERRQTLVVRTTLAAYLFTAVRNTALNARRNVLARIRQNEAQATEPREAPLGAELLLEREERERMLRVAVAALSPRYREVLLLRANGLTYEAIGEVIGLSAKTAQTRGLRGIAMLRAALEGKI